MKLYTSETVLAVCWAMFSQGVAVAVVAVGRAGLMSAAILSSAGMTPIITRHKAGAGLPLYITLSRGHEVCHGAGGTAAGDSRQHTTVGSDLFDIIRG